MDLRHDDIERYLSNRMTDAERHALEKRALSDPFIADAIEGAQSVKPEEFLSDVESLNRKVKAPSSSWKMGLRIAAGVVVAVSLGWLIWNPTSPTETAQNLSEVSAPVAVDSVNEPLSEPKSAEAKPAADAKEKVAQAAPGRKPVVTDSTRDVSPDPAAGVAALPTEPATRADVKTEVAEAEALRDDRKAAGTSAMSKEKRSTASARVITGRVTEAEDGIPLADVIVKDAASRQETRTRGDGTYSLPVQTEKPTVEYSFPGLQSVERRAGNEIPMNVELFDDVDQRSEIIAFPPSNWSSSAPDDLQLAVPSVGIQAYQKYLETNLVVPASARAAQVMGKVTISFTVDQAGIQKDFQLVKGLGHGCDEEAVRLVKTGPTWKAARYGNKSVASTIWVKLEFRPVR